MKDFESKLRDLLHERGDSARTAPNAPARVLRRVRRRQVSTVLVSTVTAAAVVAGAFAGVAVFGRSHGNGQPASFEGPTRTVTLNGVGMTYPYDWALQQVSRGGVTPGGPAPSPVESPDKSTSNPSPGSNAAGVAEATGPTGPTGGPEPTGPSGQTGTTGVTGRTGPSGPTTTGPSTAPGRPATWLQLANFLPAKGLDPSCPDGALSAGGVELRVESAGVAPGDTPGWPAELARQDRAYGCPSRWEIYSATWEAAGATYLGTAAIGPDASMADRDALFAAFESMGFPSSANGVVGGAGTVSPDGSESVSTVVAGGTTDSGDDWVMETDGNGGLLVQVGSFSAGFGVASASGDGQAAPQAKLDEAVMPVGQDRFAVFGSATSEAVRIRVRPETGDPVDIPVQAEPAVVGSDRGYFFAEASGLGRGSIVALAADGTELAAHHYDTGPYSVPGEPPANCTTASPDGSGGTSGSCTAAGGSGGAKEGPPTVIAMAPLCPNSTTAGSCTGVAETKGTPVPTR